MQPGFLPSRLGAHPSRCLAWAIQPGIRCCLKFGIGLKKKNPKPEKNLSRDLKAQNECRFAEKLLLQWAVSKYMRQRSSERVGWGAGSPLYSLRLTGHVPLPGTLAKSCLCPDDRNPPGPVPLLTSPHPPVLNVSAEQGPAAFTPARPPPRQDHSPGQSE